MATYVLKRLLQALLTLFAMSVFSFVLIRLVPGDPAQIILGAQRATPENVARLRHQLGLDESLIDQYWNFLTGVVQLDFGKSIRYRQSVSSLITPRLWPSLWLILYACVLATLVVGPLGVIAATQRNRVGDHAIRLFTTIGYAIPPFLSGLVLITIFSLQLGLFPVEGYGNDFAGHIQGLTLPAITVALFLAPLLLRTLRSELIATLSKEYIEAARARGLPNWRVLFRHALRNSLLPTLTVLGVAVGALLSINVIVENVFSIPGLGSLLTESVNTRDYPVIQALFLVFGATVVLASLITDLLYLAIDPRLRR
jgi:ABC-type dipeptide/oligopeptide/nickel transport system permease component